MKIGLISDIHCNLTGLERALDLLDDCDEVLCAGDLIYQFRFSNDVLATLRRRKVQAIPGNHDKGILYDPRHPLLGSPTIDPGQLEYLAGLPNTLSLKLNGSTVAMFHGSPWDEVRGTGSYYLFPQDHEALKRLAAVDADIIVLGHTHLPMAIWVDGRFVINPGSCGEPRDGTNNLTCAALDLSTGRLEWRRFTLP